MIDVVWFKRDLRVADHAPLAEASRRGPVLPLYIVEPEVLAGEDYSPCHWTFTAGCLRDLRRDLAALGQPLVVRVGEAVAVLREIHAAHGIARLWSHEETGNAITYGRDLAVGKWARAAGIPWQETPNGGVVRRLRGRDGWARQWEARMAAAIVPVPAGLRGVAGVAPGPIPEGRELGLGPDRTAGAQAGGAAAGRALLDSFLAGRGERYHMEMSSPLTAANSCSRLSPHLAYGTISTRMVVQRLRERKGRAWSAFDARLHWRDHFMQKLEDEPAIEFQNFVRGFDGLREDDFDAERFAAWAEGRTGYPMVDACMRCLRETGWINFRMRAMVTSFAAYHLWLHWRPVGLHLARLFVDYEPGIHWSQCQMQSGTTGINTLRIYNPLKQAEDHDPAGVFARRWIPELGTDGYVAPIVEHAEAVRAARARLGEFRRRAGVRDDIAEVARKHGSRKGRARKPKRVAKAQLGLFDGEGGDQAER